MDEDDELSDESFGQWCVDEPLDEFEDDPPDELLELLLELGELVDVDVEAFEAANACPAPTPPMTAAEASMLARTARRIFEVIAASPPFAVAHVGAEQTIHVWESPVSGRGEGPESGRGGPVARSQVALRRCTGTARYCRGP